MAQPALKTVSAQDYFEMEETAFEKSEYYQGEIFVMSGASVNHNLIVMNTSSALHVKLSDSGCFVFPSDIKVELAEDEYYVYPDISVVCGEIAYGSGRNDIITNPKVIVEVLSESTRDYDRGGKFAAYRELPSLTDYILIDQYQILVEHFVRKSRDLWELRMHRSPEDMLAIDSLEISLPVTELYKNIKN